VTACAFCGHLRTAHTVPSGLCQLCTTCPGWTPTSSQETHMADIGDPQREVTFEPIEQPQPVHEPAPTVPDREPVPA
jgi:hypothetical protein